MDGSELLVAVLNYELDEFHLRSVTDLDRLVLQASPLRKILALANLRERLCVRLLAALDDNFASTGRVELDLSKTLSRDLDEQFLRIKARGHPEGSHVSRVEHL